ncbi:MAG: glycosyltransferase family 4 protein [Blastocatellales bacterium]
MRFLFVSDFVCEWNSGSAGSILSIGEALIRRGHTVDYLWKDDHAPRLPHPSLDRLFGLPRRQFRQIREQLLKADYDVVIVSQPYAYPVYEQLPKLYPNTLFLNRTHGWEDRFNRARLKWCWDLKKGSLDWMLAWASAIVARRLFRRTARACHGLIAPSSLGANFVSDSYGVPKDKIAVIPYGLSEVFLNVDVNRQKASQGMKLLFVGSYLARKGTRILESALPALAPQFPNLEITFVVPNESIDIVKAKYESSFGHRLNVLGWQKRSQLVELYSQHDIFLFPSLFEGFGKVFIEAMVCGMCVIGFDEGGLSDIARSGEPALFCQTGDILGFQKLLEGNLASPEFIRQVGWKAQQVTRGFTWDRTASETENFCALLLKNRLQIDRVDISQSNCQQNLGKEARSVCE